MTEFNAMKAKEIQNNREHWISEFWYLGYYDTLFNKIKNAALSGKDHLTLKEICWNKEDANRDYLEKRLVSLGYDIRVTDETETEEMIIAW